MTQPLLINLNPFEDDIVSEPRDIEKHVVSGLNDRPLQALLEKFEYLEMNERPRKEKLSHAQFVVSPAPGYGKSHLIGRLFRALNHRATLVYLRPFDDASTCWKSILLKMVQELDFPDSEEPESYNTEVPTQLEAFAHGVLTHLMTDAVEGGVVRPGNKESMLKNLREGTVEMFRKNKTWLTSVRKHYNGIVNECSEQLRAKGIRLKASLISWIGVLFTYAYFPSEFELRQACLDWLQGGSIDPEDAKQIGITSVTDIPGPEMGSGECNELCKDRIADFCQLAGFFRPFVFCFDQTENYGREIVLTKAFGTVIQVLTDDVFNQMTVVTANQKPWSSNIEPWLEHAHRDRLARPPLELEGLNQDQALELIEYRFDRLDADEKQRFIGNGKRLTEFFQDRGEFCIREFLERCSIRWRVVIGSGSITKPSIAESYKKAVKQIKTHPKRLVFDPNTLYWLVNEAAKGLPGFEAKKYQSPKGYFTLVWKSDNQEICFGFESGSHWKRWQAIAREAKNHHIANFKSKAVFFRTPELKEIPGPTWKKSAEDIKAAKEAYLHILRLGKSEMSECYAAHDLYVDAVGGNIPFQRHEVLDFISEKLTPFWERIKKTLPEPNGGIEPGKVTKKLIEEIRKVVQKNKFMSVEAVIKKLSTPISEELFHEARRRIPEIKVHVGPGKTVVQWQSKK